MNKRLLKSGPFRVRLSAEKETRRERPKSAPYLRLKNIQGTTIGKIWKKNFFSKKILIFFRKKYFLGRTMPKNSLKNLWFSAGFEPTLSGWVEDER